jgi:RepB plasmid partitioning protein
LLKERPVNPVTFDVLRKMKPARQLESCKLMASAANFTSAYAKALLAATRERDLAKAAGPKRVAGMTSADLVLMEREMRTVQRDFRAVERTYGEDILNPVIATGYVSKLIRNHRIERYLEENHPENLREFRVIVSSASLQESGEPIPDRAKVPDSVPRTYSTKVVTSRRPGARSEPRRGL